MTHNLLIYLTFYFAQLGWKSYKVKVTKESIVTAIRMQTSNLRELKEQGFIFSCVITGTPFHTGNRAPSVGFSTSSQLKMERDENYLKYCT